MPLFWILFDGCHFHREYGMHEKPKMAHVMEDGSAEHFKFLSRG
jgi:hypothetical protein